MLHCLHHCCNCRDCSNALAYEGKEDCVFNWSNLFLITYELGFSYADNMCISRLPFSQHFKVLYNAHSHSGNVKLLMTRPTHRCRSCNPTVAAKPQHVSRQTGLYCDNSVGQICIFQRYDHRLRHQVLIVRFPCVCRGTVAGTHTILVHILYITSLSTQHSIPCCH